MKNIFKVIICSIILFTSSSINAQYDLILNIVASPPEVAPNSTNGFILVRLTNNSEIDVPQYRFKIDVSVNSLYVNVNGVTDLPVGWEICYLDASTIVLSAGSDVIPALESREFKVNLLALNNEGSGNLVGNIVWSGGTDATKCLSGPQLPGDNPDNNSSVTTIRVDQTLPVNLLSFQAKTGDCRTNVSWTVGEEVSFSQYDVMRSKDGKKFEKVHTIKPSGSFTTYSFADEKVDQGGRYFYRLKMNDNDGSVSYSNVAAVNVDCGDKMDLRIFPNPANAYINVELAGFGKAASRTAEILDSRGHVVKTIELGTGTVNNVNIESLISGMYMLRLIDVDGVSEKKFVKIN